MRLLSLGMAVINLSAGAFFAAVFLWLCVTAILSMGQTLLYTAVPLLVTGVAAVFFLVVGRACWKTVRAGKNAEAEPAETCS